MAYRKAARSCEMCRRELAADEELAPVAGMEACPACREEVPHQAAEAWRLRIRTQEKIHEKQGRHSGEHVRAVVQVGLPTEIILSAVFKAEDALDRAAARFTGGDLSTGHEDFDDRVWIESLDGETARQLLEDAGVRLALADAVEAAGAVHMSPRGLRLVTRQGSFDIEQLDAMDRAGIVLGVAMERWARGAPGAEPTRDGCRDRPPEPRDEASGQLPQDQPAPPPADSTYHKRAEPGPPCPRCGELMTNALTEWLCKHCHHTEERPEVIARIRKRELITKLIVIAIVLGLFMIIGLGVYLEHGAGK